VNGTFRHSIAHSHVLPTHKRQSDAALRVGSGVSGPTMKSPATRDLQIASILSVAMSHTGHHGLVDTQPQTTARKSTPEDPDMCCINMLQNGNGRGLDILMERHAENLNRFIFRYTNNAEDAADLTQETFVRVFKKAGDYKPKARVKTWLYTIALNLCRDRGRRSTLVKWVPFLCSVNDDSGELGPEDTTPDDYPDPCDSASAHELERIISKGIADLPDSIKAPFTLYVLEGLPQAEVAELLKLTVKSVEVKVYRARQQLRKILAPFQREFDFF